MSQYTCNSQYTIYLKKENSKLENVVLGEDFDHFHEILRIYNCLRVGVTGTCFKHRSPILTNSTRTVLIRSDDPNVKCLWSGCQLFSRFQKDELDML